MQRLRAMSVRATVMFFGSARSKDHDQHKKAVAKAQARLAAAEAGSEEAAAATGVLSRLESMKWMCDYMEKIRELARMITQWSVNSATRHLEVLSGVARVARLKRKHEESFPEGSEGGLPLKRELSAGAVDKITYKPHSSDDVSVAPGGTASPHRRAGDSDSLPV